MTSGISLSAVQADGFYNPPDWDPSKCSRDQFQGSKGSNQYEQKGLIRFEMPWDAWCRHCDEHIGRGVRYNAKKDFRGHYHSTPLWRFTMRCHLCKGEMVIDTSPQTADYVCISGCKKRTVNYEESGATDRILEESHKERMGSDPMYRMAHRESEKRKAIKEAERLSDLIAIKDRDELALNSQLRKEHRVRLKEGSMVPSKNR